MIREVIETASRAVSIIRLYRDRGLYRVALVNASVDPGVEFLVRAPKTPGIERVLAERDEESFVTEYELVSKRSPVMRVPVRLLVVPPPSRDDDSLCPITNRSVREDEALPLAEAYRRRWGIETFYRKLGEFLRADRTRQTSVPHVPRQITIRITVTTNLSNQHTVIYIPLVVFIDSEHGLDVRQ